jgi:hypothetical protein
VNMLDATIHRAAAISVTRVLLWLLTIVPLVLGIVIGFTVRVLALLWAACVVGYERGRG